MIITFLKTTAGKIAVTLLLGIVLGFAGHWLWGAPSIVKVPGTSSVETKYFTEKPVIQPTKEILKLVADPTEVSKFLKEQEALKTQVTMLTETIANLQRTGEGKITYVDRPVPGTTQVVREASFEDWRLKFTAKGENASYLLSQRFETIATAGKDVDGKPTASVKMFEIGPGQTRTELPIAKSTVILANPGKRWFFAPTVQAGLGYFTDLKAQKPGALVGLQWLKRGTSKAAEDSLYSVLTPVFTGTETYREFGILPFSINVGRAPYQPFKDLWVSPYVGANKHYGVAITASF